jgi:hypothetical protein
LFLMSIGMSVTKGSKEGRSPVLLSEAWSKAVCCFGVRESACRGNLSEATTTNCLWPRFFARVSVFLKLIACLTRFLVVIIGASAKFLKVWSLSADGEPKTRDCNIT